MERSKKDKKDKKKKKGDKFPVLRSKLDGNLILRKPIYRRIKPKEVVDDLPPQAIGLAIKHFEVIKDGKGAYSVKKAEQIQIESKDVPSEEYTIKHKAGQYYNVVSPEGKVMNPDKGLTAEDAEKLKESLEAEKA